MLILIAYLRGLDLPAILYHIESEMPVAPLEVQCTMNTTLAGWHQPSCLSGACARYWRAIRKNPAPIPIAPVTRLLAGASRSTEIAKVTIAIAQRFIIPITSKTTSGPAEHRLHCTPRRSPCFKAVPALGGAVWPLKGNARQQRRQHHSQHHDIPHTKEGDNRAKPRLPGHEHPCH
jgi:hypothetical protein